jgi:hypothetical protein
MTEFLDGLPKDILAKGIVLEELGVSDIAWLREDALDVIEIAKHQGKALLGGDVCVFENSGWNFNYDNWHCEPTPNENLIDFCNRSAETGIKYVKSYPIKENVAFILVFGKCIG